MIKRTLVIIALATLVCSEASARTGIFFRKTTPRQPAKAQPARPGSAAMNDPGKLTELYGPSILIRDEKVEPSSNVVQQPE